VNWYWNSDFDGLLATTVTYVVTDNADGTANVSVVAYY
jgi:hypothetical protein